MKELCAPLVPLSLYDHEAIMIVLVVHCDSLECGDFPSPRFFYSPEFPFGEIYIKGNRRVSGMAGCEGWSDSLKHLVRAA